MQMLLKQSNEKRILITGNGFDLALGLPTSYIEFIQAARQAISSPSGHIRLDEVFPEKFDTLKIYYTLETSYDLSEINKHRSNAWLSYFLTRNPPKEQSDIEKKWVDFEREIRQILEDVTLLKREIETVEIETKREHDGIGQGPRKDTKTDFHAPKNPAFINEQSFKRLNTILGWSEQIWVKKPTQNTKLH